MNMNYKKTRRKNQKELNTKTDIDSHQIRSYVLQPYQLVKDLRNKTENTNPQDVLNGNLDQFIEEGLKFINEKNYKIFFFILFFFQLLVVLVILSTIGIETSKFNTLINNQIQNNSNNLKNKTKFNKIQTRYQKT